MYVALTSTIWPHFAHVIGSAGLGGGLLAVLSLVLIVVALLKNENPNWLWLCAILFVALGAEVKLAAKLLRQKQDDDEPKISAKAHGEALAHALAEMQKRMGEEKTAEG
jgi:hypothetical protein